jgi:hypothetical protein
VGARSRRKGADGEREVVALAQAVGLPASREWQNAQASNPATRRCDVLLDGKPAQVKVAAEGFAKLYDGLEAVEFLFVRSDRRPWLVVLPAERLLALLKGWGR